MWHWIDGSTIFCLVVLAAAGIGWRNVWFAYASRRWPTTSARLHYLGISDPGGGGRCEPAVRYSYTVDGATYESTRWRFGSSQMSRQALADAMSTQIKPIDPVVFYDPNKPARSCLVAGLDEKTLAIPIIASAMALLALVAKIR